MTLTLREFERQLRAPTLDLGKMTVEFDAEVSHYNSAVTKLGKQGVNFVLKNNIITNTNVLAARNGIVAAGKVVGLELGKMLKFKPWGAIKMADGLKGALSVLGQALVDSGNTAFREKKFDLALDFYRKASESDPTHAAPWFGTYMVGQAIKNTALADSALAMVRARAPEMKARPGGAPALPPGTPAPFSPHRDVKSPGTTS